MRKFYENSNDNGNCKPNWSITLSVIGGIKIEKIFF